ncbi:hypothetical protein Dvina_17005 [Dactylosporangium vinaceum]|uniref:Uncharacterized protein n=1 Tax=Dactylosporangium vinaceum TaxID=53362 RepID=A0ABV5MKA9_9ACTN|nr:hypothetical protein [Dactylosporangium vinaceum]UAB99616.1 hypothetical protein Dvina_17005 [Dactylosporangium vinaceum]
MELVTTPAAGRWALAGKVVDALLLAADGSPNTDATTPAVRGHLVVTRRDTGQTLLRMPAWTDGTLADQIRYQLDVLTVREFLQRWKIDPNGAPA